jgi:hypothetical protein
MRAWAESQYAQANPNLTFSTPHVYSSIILELPKSCSPNTSLELSRTALVYIYRTLGPSR